MKTRDAKTAAQSASNSGLWTANFLLICLSTLSVTIAFHSLIPTLPIYITTHGGSKEIIGMAMAFLTIAAVIVRPIAGWSLDNLGHKPILLMGLVVFLLPSVIFTLMIPIAALLWLRLLQGFGWGVSTTALGTVAADLIPKHKFGEGLGFYSLTTSISLAISPAIGLWLIDKFSFQTLFLTGSFLTILAFCLALLIKYPAPKPRIVKAKLVFLEKPALPPAIVIMLITVTYSSLLSFLAVFARQKGLSSAGLFFLTMAITTLVSRPLSGRLVDRFQQRGYDFLVVSGSLAIICAIMVLARTTISWHLIIGGVCFGVGFGFIQPSMLALCIASLPPARSGAANATYWTAFDSGVFIGSILWGFVASALGYPAMLNLNIIPPILALLFYLLWRRTHLAVSNLPKTIIRQD